VYNHSLTHEEKKHDSGKREIKPNDVFMEAYGDGILNDVPADLQSLTLEAFAKGSNSIDQKEDDRMEALALESCGSKGPERSLSNLMNKTTQL